VSTRAEFKPHKLPLDRPLSRRVPYRWGFVDDGLWTRRTSFWASMHEQASILYAPLDRNGNNGAERQFGVGYVTGLSRQRWWRLVGVGQVHWFAARASCKGKLRPRVYPGSCGCRSLMCIRRRCKWFCCLMRLHSACLRTEHVSGFMRPCIHIHLLNSANSTSTTEPLCRLRKHPRISK